MKDRDLIDGLSEKERRKAHKRKGELHLNRYREESLARDVDRVLQSADFKTPGEFLAHVMRGNDPRCLTSPVLDLIVRVRARGLDELPTLDEWLELVEYISENEKYHKTLIPIDHSLKAAEKLSSVLYAAKNKTEVDQVTTIRPMTKKEIKRYNKQFEKEF